LQKIKRPPQHKTEASDHSGEIGDVVRYQSIAAGIHGRFEYHFVIRIAKLRPPRVQKLNRE